MPDLIPRPTSAPAKRRSGGLPNIEHHLDLDRAIAAAAIGMGGGPGWPAVRVDDARDRADAIERVQYHEAWLAEQIAERMPTDSVARCLALLREALDTPPDRKITMAAVGLLVSSRARQPASPEVFIQALEFDLVDMGFSPTVVVVALQRLRRERTFMPEISEVITACREERDRLRKTLERVEGAVRYRRQLEEARAKIPALMAQAEALPERPMRRGAR